MKRIPSLIQMSVSGGDIVLAAAEEKDGKKLRRFSMMAYGGGKMVPGGWPYPVVLEFSGLVGNGKKPRAILMNHNPDKIVGHSDSIDASSGKLIVKGLISGASDAAREVLESSDNGFPWQASIGASIKKAIWIPEGKTGKANGQEVEGPCYIIKQARLGEVSFVPVGADETTSASVAAGLGVAGEVTVDEMEVEAMGFENWVKAKGLDLAALDAAKVESLRAEYEQSLKAAASVPPAAPAQATPQGVNASAAIENARVEAQMQERQRVAGIRSICAGELNELEAEAIDKGYTLDTVRAKALEQIRAKRPSAPAVITNATGPTPVKVMEAALSLRIGCDEKSLLASFGEQTLGAAYAKRHISLREVLIECARSEGKAVGFSMSNDDIRASFSTVSVPGLLNNVANKALMRSFNEQPAIAPRLCSEGDLTNFKTVERYRLNDVGDVQPVAQDGELKHLQVSEEKATNQLETYGAIFALTRKMVIDDDLGAFTAIPTKLGATCARKRELLFWTRLLANPTQADGYALFADEHNNYVDGVDSALSIAALSVALQMFEKQTDASGRPIAISPAFLVVPSDLKMTAREILGARSVLAVGDTDLTRIPNYNPVAEEGLSLISTPYLNNAGLTGGSAVAWYLFANPAQIETFQIGYLRGQRTPVVEQSSTDFDTLGMRFRVYWDLGIREQETRGMLKSKGAA